MSENLEPISFASVYCKQTKKGGYSNYNGEITLVDLNKNDTIIISSIGFKTKIIKVSELSDTLILEKSFIDLKEFTVKSEYKRKTFGVTRKILLRKTHRGKYVGLREGVVITINKKSQLENVELFIIKAEDSSRTKFLLMVNSVDDSTNLPGESLLSKKIFFDVSKKGWSKINVDSLNIQINEKVYIGIEIVPNYDFNDAPKMFSFTNKKHAVFGFISYFIENKSLFWVHEYIGNGYSIGINAMQLGANNNFPMIKATVKY